MMKNTWSMVMMTHVNVDDDADNDDDEYYGEAYIGRFWYFDVWKESCEKICQI